MKLMLGNCLDKLKELDDNSVDSIVTDPPYGLSFMGKKWDYDVPAVNIWEECFRVLKPGGHLLAFAGTRTQHRMAVNIEDAGFEIRDMIAWVYGSGFPKSHNISKAIDKMAGAEREVISEQKTNSGGMAHISKTNAEHGFRPNAYTGNSADKTAQNVIQVTAPATPEAQHWDGWGTALKPALEPITVARKPIAEKSIAENVLKYGTGAINIDESRVEGQPEPTRFDPKKHSHEGWRMTATGEESAANASPKGRFPANLIHDGSDEVVELARESARFFYCAKASKKDRDEGLDHMEEQQFVQWQTGNGASGKPSSMSEGRDTKRKNTHPTVKPTDLMKYLVRMVTPKGGVVLDPFMGSGSTGKAAKLEGFDFIGIEMDEEYFLLAKSRIDGIMVESTLEDFFA
jgi:DNA modification methylase